MFQSTRPVWGATALQVRHLRQAGVSIHAPRVGRDDDPKLTKVETWVSIHAPRVGRDAYQLAYEDSRDVSIHAPRVGRDYGVAQFRAQLLFQSTRPVWGATVKDAHIVVAVIVSIHAPRVGRDLLEA